MTERDTDISLPIGVSGPDSEGRYALVFKDRPPQNLPPALTDRALELVHVPATEQIHELYLLKECYLKGLNYLARREHSSLQLAQKLAKKSFSRHTIQDCLKLLDLEGSLSDNRFARQWILQRLTNHPEGRQLLILGLRSRGLDETSASAAVTGFFEENPEAEDQACLNFLLKARRTGIPMDEIIIKAKKRAFTRKILEKCHKEFYSLTGCSYL